MLGLQNKLSEQFYKLHVEAYLCVFSLQTVHRIIKLHNLQEI